MTETNWIALSERKPMETDADETGLILAHTGYYCDMVIWDRNNWNNTIYTHFLPLPRFPKTDPDEEAFKKFDSEFAKQLGLASDPVYVANRKQLWDAAIKYARST